MAQFNYWELALAFAMWAIVFYLAGRQHMKDRVKKLTKANSSLIADLNTGLTITTSQRDEYNRIVQEHKVLNEQQNEVIVFIRENFRYLMDGRFTSFSQLVIGVVKRDMKPPAKQDIDEKYSVLDGRIVKTSNGVPIPPDEPMFLFRGRDRLAVPTLVAYKTFCESDECVDYQLEAMERIISKFSQYATTHPELMKQPGITRGL